MSQIVTANRLVDGVVVFQDAAGLWTEDFASAAVLPDEAAVTAGLSRATEAVAASLVVDPYAIEVEQRNGHYAPTALREAIGPPGRREARSGQAGVRAGAAFALTRRRRRRHVSL